VRHFTLSKQFGYVLIDIWFHFFFSFYIESMQKFNKSGTQNGRQDFAECIGRQWWSACWLKEMTCPSPKLDFSVFLTVLSPLKKTAAEFNLF